MPWLSSRSASWRSRCIFDRRWSAAARAHSKTPEWPPRSRCKTHHAARCKTHRWLRFVSRLAEQSSLIDHEYDGPSPGSPHYNRRLFLHLPALRQHGHRTPLLSVVRCVFVLILFGRRPARAPTGLVYAIVLCARIFKTQGCEACGTAAFTSSYIPSAW